MIYTLSTYARLALPLLVIAASGCGTDDDGQNETEHGSTTAATESTGPQSGSATSGPSTVTTSTGATDSEATTDAPTDGTVGTVSEATTDSPTNGTNSTDGTDGTESSTGSESSGGVKGVDPGALSVMIANQYSGVHVFTVEDGVATEDPGSPFEMNASMTTLTLLGDQLFVAELAQFSEDIFSFALDPKTGSLSATAATSFNGMKRSGAAHPNMPVVYFTDTVSNSIGAFSAAADGGLTSIGVDVAPGQFPSGVDITPNSVAVDPSGTHVYVTAVGALYTYDVQPDGSLVEAAGAQGDFLGATGLVVDEADACAYVASLEGIGVATLAADGTPSALPSSYDETVAYRSVRTVPGEADLIVISGTLRTRTVRVDGPGACELGTDVGMISFGEHLSSIQPVDGGHVAAIVRNRATQLHVVTIDPSGSLEEIDGSPFMIDNGAMGVEIRVL